MTFPMYASPEQFMRDRSEYARKGIGRGRSVVVTACAAGVLLVAENPSPTLHKVSEVYDRIAFAGVGRYNEFENLRTAGIRMADVRGFSYDRSDVTGRWLASAYAQTLGAIFSESSKPYEVELCVAEVGRLRTDDQIYRISYDGSIFDEDSFVVMGGGVEAVSTAMSEVFAPDWELPDAVCGTVHALGAATTATAQPRELGVGQLEVALLDRTRSGRTFVRFDAGHLAEYLGDKAP